MSPMMRALRRENGRNREQVPAYTTPFGATRERVDMLPRINQPTVAILLSTYNGASFLAAQLHSFLAQTHHDWTLYWRDDGSTDASRRLVREFAEQIGNERCVFSGGGGCRQITRSFLGLLGSARAGAASHFAFSDQDDVWLPEKLARGIAALEAVPAGLPALYCAQRIVVDSALWRTGEPGKLRQPPGFPSALTQNIAPGCTMMMNRAAADLVLASAPPDAIWHDWWCYVIVAASGGQILADPTATVLYRQHGGNHVGEPLGTWRRGIAALRRGPVPFMRLLRAHVATLQVQRDALPAETQQQIDIIAHGLQGGVRARLRALRLRGFRRQTMLETLVFRIWFMIG